MWDIVKNYVNVFLAPIRYHQTMGALDFKGFHKEVAENSNKLDPLLAEESEAVGVTGQSSEFSDGPRFFSLTLTQVIMISWIVVIIGMMIGMIQSAVMGSYLKSFLSQFLAGDPNGQKILEQLGTNSLGPQLLILFMYPLGALIFYVFWRFMFFLLFLVFEFSPPESVRELTKEERDWEYSKIVNDIIVSSYPSKVLSIFPIIGGILEYVWGMVIIYAGLRYRLKASPWLSVLFPLSPLIFSFCFIIAAASLVIVLRAINN